MDQTQQNGKGVADSQAASCCARNKLMDELKHAIGEAEDWLKDAAKELAPSPETRARFEETLRTARTDLRKLEDSVIARSRGAAESANVYVRDNPWKSVGLGAAIGVIVGLLVARK
ncbi:membrane protein [Duganella rhizosphaerae]|uniref:DUF883 family protein n=1 Tax=Duganella rhizosphaerae TaxID=2885763 RepID=UPI0030E9A147